MPNKEGQNGFWPILRGLDTQNAGDSMKRHPLPYFFLITFGISWGVPGLFMALSALLLTLLRGTEGPMEELGWRGYALPLLQRRYNGLTASLILGCVWALWHLPAIVIGRAGMGGGLSGGLVHVLLVFLAGTVAQSIILTVLYNGTQGLADVLVTKPSFRSCPAPSAPRTC